MALDQSALLELTDALRSADGGEMMRRLLMLQALIDAEATATSAPRRTSAPRPAESPHEVRPQVPPCATRLAPAGSSVLRQIEHGEVR